MTYFENNDDADGSNDYVKVAYSSVFDFNDKSMSVGAWINIDDNDEAKIKQAFINPEILSEEGEEWAYEEGCLSIPDISLDLERYDKIKVRYYSIEGRVIKKPLSGFISRCNIPISCKDSSNSNNCSAIKRT